MFGFTELTDRDRERYDRQIMMEDFGEEGQKKLKSTTALVAGAGGLGSLASIYLAVAGIGRLKVVDSDVVELSNLNRQILYGDEDVGDRKADVLEKVLRGINNDIEIEAINSKITDDSIEDLTDGCDLIVDCMDNYPTRFVLNRGAIDSKIPLFHAAVEGMRGQAMTIIPGETACLKCLNPNPSSSGKFPILGATAGLLATIQVHEVVKHVVGFGELLKNELLMVSEGREFEKVEIQRNPDCEACGTL